MQTGPRGPPTIVRAFSDGARLDAADVVHGCLLQAGSARLWGSQVAIADLTTELKRSFAQPDGTSIAEFIPGRLPRGLIWSCESKLRDMTRNVRRTGPAPEEPLLVRTLG